MRLPSALLMALLACPGPGAQAAEPIRRVSLTPPRSVAWAAHRPPYIRQETLITCGPACIRSVLTSRGLAAPAERDLAQEVGTDAQDGTVPESLAQGARAHGLAARVAENMTFKGLLRALRKGRSVVVSYKASNGQGHWAVLMGYERGRVHLMDPDMELDAYPSELSFEEFMNAWWDTHHGRVYRRSAVILGD